MEMIFTKEKRQFELDPVGSYFKITSYSIPYGPQSEIGLVFLYYKEKGMPERTVDIRDLWTTFMFEKGMDLEKVCLICSNDQGEISIERYSIDDGVPSNIVTVSSFSNHYPNLQD